MSRHVPNAPPPRVAIMNAFSHVDLRLNWRSLRTLTADVIPGVRQLWGVGLRLVRERSASVAHARLKGQGVSRRASRLAARRRCHLASSRRASACVTIRMMPPRMSDSGMIQ